MTKPKRISLYRPHRRVQEHGGLINPHTGDVTIPPSMTKQEFVRECDVNNVIKQYKTSGMVSHINAKAAQGAYTDLPDSVDFQESLHTIMVAEKAFMTLPAKVRDRFGQDPAEFLAFLSNPENADEARKLGMLKPQEAAPPPIKVEVTNPSEKPDDQKA
jgi:phage internal scaffolding protein